MNQEGSDRRGTMNCPHCRAVIAQNECPPAVCPNCGLSFIDMATRYRRELLALWVWFNIDPAYRVQASAVMQYLESALRFEFSTTIGAAKRRILSDMERTAWVETKEEVTV